MKQNWKTRTLWKVLLPILQILCITTTVVFTLLACYILERSDMRQVNSTNMIQTARQTITKNNSMLAATHVADKSYGRNLLSDSNFQYGIITGYGTDPDRYIKQLTADRLSDPKLYAFQNFKDLSLLDPKNTKEITILHYPCDENSRYYPSAEGFLSTGSILTDQSTDKHTIEGFGIDTKSRIPYVKADGTWYPLSNEFSYYTQIRVGDKRVYTSVMPDSDEKNLLTEKEIQNVITQKQIDAKQADVTHEIGYGDSESGIENGSIHVLPKDLKSLNADQMKKEHKLSTKKATLDSIATFTTNHSASSEEAIIVSYVPQQLDTSLNDSYVKAAAFIRLFYNNRYLFIIGAILSLIGFIITTTLFICLSGHVVDPMPGSNEENIRKLSDGSFLQRWGIARIPMDLWVLLFFCYIGITGAWASSTTYGFRNIMLSAILYCIIGGVVAECLLYILVVNVKLGNMVRRTLLCRILYAFIGIKSASNLKKKAFRGFVLVTGIEFIAFLFMSSAITSSITGILFVCWVFLRAAVFFALREGTNALTKTLDTAVAERMKSERFQTQLITNVSHDIKTPLTSIISYVDLLSKEDLKNEKAEEYVSVLSRQSARLKKLIQDLIDASKASSGCIPLHMQKVNSSVILSQAAGEFEEKLKANGITLQTFVTANETGNSNEMYVSADPQQLWRIFNNLLSNISKYAQHSTRAYVDLEEKDGWAHFIFRNISAQALHVDADELLERFVQGDTSRSTEGSGLGLAIAKSLTELMGGTFRLTVDGDLFKVTVSLPVLTVEEAVTIN
ncbi:Signal transduction histidine kinase [Lachnospiraceae bacterium KHCPX20]|nr:Signal transduction histidine kinase [Lachnospiraceae bacterium KHCPX20]